jgi:Na+/proline symporter
MLIRIVVSLIYIAILILFAVRARRRTQDIEDYYVGGRSVPTLLVVLSFYATFVSTNSFVGHSAKSYDYGVSWMIVGLILVLLTLFSWLFIAPRFRQKAESLRSIVPSDFFGLHFRSARAGAIAAAIILFDSVFFLAAVFLGASESMGALLGIPFGYALAIVFVVQLTYTSVGGYLADVWSDSLQATILFAGAIAIPIALGGLKLVADPRQLSRFYALRQASSARQGVLLIVTIVAVTYLFLLPIGLLSRAYDVPAEIAGRTDAIVPWLLSDVQILGPTLGAIVLTALLAAAMSTIDSVLLVAGAALQRDILPILGRKSASSNVHTARKIVIVYAILPLGLAALARLDTSMGFGIVELTVFAGALYAAAFLPGLMGILYWKRASAAGAILGMVLGVVSTGVWRFVVAPTYPSLETFPEVFVGLMCGGIAFVVGSLLMPRRGDEGA